MQINVERQYIDHATVRLQRKGITTMEKIQTDTSSRGNISNQTNSMDIFESNKPLSRSMIWQLQREFYANQGPDAWRKGIVPQYITTNPYIANLYAKTVFAYCRDIAGSANFDKSSTIYIVELAAGVGRFTYTFLTRLLHLMENSSLNTLKIKYIVSDLAERNVEYWLNHGHLKPYFAEGILDCATFDMTEDEELNLRYSGDVLKKGTMKNPLILFANYTFDSLPQDTFYVNEGILYEGLITLTKTESKDNVDDKSILANLDYSYTNHEIDGSNYYEDSSMNDILHTYQSCLDDTAFTIPNKAIECINRLRDIFKDDILLISSDKGYRNLTSLEKVYHPYLSSHGSISLMVNFHALGLYFDSIGGSAVHSIYENDNVTMSIFMLTDRNHDFMETTIAFEEIVETIGPDDFYTMKKTFMAQHPSLSTKELLTFLRYSLWDARTFLELYNTLLDRIAKEEDFPKYEMIMGIHQIWDHYFPIGEDENLAYCLGSILAYFGHGEDAIELFEYSIKYKGEDPVIYYEIALCHYDMENIERTLECLDKSLSFDPTFEESLNLKQMLLSDFED